MPISLGKGQGDKVKALIFDKCTTNHWILLQNCHLATSWLPELEIIIETLGSHEYAKKLSHQFRLFLTAMPTENFPLSIL